jgi:hypothetical protein
MPGHKGHPPWKVFDRKRKWAPIGSGRREPTGEPAPATENAQGRRASTLPAARPEHGRTPRPTEVTSAKSPNKRARLRPAARAPPHRALLAQFFLYQVEVHFPGGVLAMEPDQIRENVATCLKILLSAFDVSLLLQQGA